MKKYICICGHARAGKDTFSEFLNDELKNKGFKTLVIHYADLVKFICKSYFGWNGKKDECGRTLLQRIGTDVVRVKEPDYWANFVVDFIKLFDEDEWDYIIVPDTRFENEINIPIEKFGEDKVITIRIERDFNSELTDEQKNHPSETALNDYITNFIVDNNGSIDELEESAKTICDYISK